MHEGSPLFLTPEKLFTELESAGFSTSSIKMAFSWLENLSTTSHELVDAPSEDTIRVFQGMEADFIDITCQAYLYYLTTSNILNLTTRELVINQLLHLKELNIDVSLIKWVTLLVLYNQENSKEALERMELLVLHDQEDTVH